MDILEFIKSRRSTRKFTAKEIEAEKLDQILEAGRYAPSGGNSQSTHSLVIRNKDVLAHLQNAVRKAFAAMEEYPGMYRSMVNSIRAAKKGNYVFHYHAPVLILCANQKDYGWCSSTIVNILKRREYLGHTINFKTRKHFKDKKSHYVDESEWTIFENTHPAIIDQETFDNVQRIRGNVRRYPDGWGKAAPLTGLLYCADCGGKMYVHRSNNGKRVHQYTCGQYGREPVGTRCPSQHRINEKVVLDLISAMLQAISDYAKSNRAAFIREVQEAQARQHDSDIKKKKRRLAAAQKRAGELERLVCKIYEDNALGRLPDARYAALDAQYAKEQEELAGEISELEKTVSGFEQGRKSAEKFIALIDKYQGFDTMTTTMLNEFVEKILVHERDRKGSIETTQAVEVYFNFVGKYIPPVFREVELTPEEQEALRKKEELKDKRHQAYLRRKASGWQRQYEERTRPGKKAKIDAMKATIRQEDMAKGIYAHVADLPHQEPKRAAMQVRPTL